jgi:hypothetical protein
MKNIGGSIAALLFLAVPAFSQCTSGQIAVRSGLPPNTTTVCLTPDAILPILGEYWKQDSPAIINSNFTWLANNSFPNPMTTRGDLIYRDASAAARLPIGLSGSALVSNGTDPIWARYSYSDLSGVPTQFAPSLHANLHATGQADAIAPSTIGAMAALSGTGAVKVTSGAPGLVSGSAGDCVHVDGSSAACQAAFANIYVVASQAAQLALSAHQGDICIRSDESKTYVQNGGSAGTMADWTVLQTPSSAVQSVNGYVGVVSLAASDVGAPTTTGTGATGTWPIGISGNAATATTLSGTQTAHYVFVGPASGSAAAPTFRALVSADIPNNAANTSGTASNIANNTGTVSTVLHGNATGAPSFGAVVAADITANTITPSKMSVYEHQFVMTGSGTGGLLQDTDDQPIIWTNHSGGNLTIGKIWCRTDSTTALTMQFQKDDGSPASMFSSNLSCTSTESSGTVAFVSGENVLADGNSIGYQTVLAGGGAHWVSVHYTVTY